MSTNSITNSSSSPHYDGDESSANSSGATSPVASSIRIGGGSYTVETNVPDLESMLRKRLRDGGDIGAGPSVPPQLRPVPPAAPAAAVVAAPVVDRFMCFICNIEFDTDRSLAGHMRMHPERPWQGMFAPAVLTSNDHFANVIDLLNPEENVADGGETEAEEDEAAAEEDEAAAEEEEAAAEEKWIVPDLNKTPPNN